MAHFLFHGSYSSDAMAALVHEPEDRSVYIHSILEQLKGRLDGFWLGFGTGHFYAIAQLPDAQSAAAFAISIVASGGVTDFTTVPLLTWSEGIAAMNLARNFGYHPPMREPEGEPRD